MRTFCLRTVAIVPVIAAVVAAADWPVKKVKRLKVRPALHGQTAKRLRKKKKEKVMMMVKMTTTHGQPDDDST